MKTRVLDLAGHLPSEAAEALLELATGGTPQVPGLVVDIDPFDHPDAQRRFRIMRDWEELERALDYPWDKWAVFLHPAQRAHRRTGLRRAGESLRLGGDGEDHRRTPTRRTSGPHESQRKGLADDILGDPCQRPCATGCGFSSASEPRIGERVEVYAIDVLGERLYRLNIGDPSFASEAQIVPLIEAAARTVNETRFSPSFMLTEWNQVVDAWQLDTWEAYRDVPRLGRRRRLPESHRQVLWSIFEQVRSGLSDRNFITRAQMFSQLTSMFGKTQPSPFEFNVVDEAQDIGVAQLRFLAALGAERPDGLFFAGDLGQRIFQQPFSWQALGVEIRGRSRTLKINYRTSHQIRMRSERLLGPELSDADGNTEERSGTISVFNGAEPSIAVSDSEDDESKTVATWLTELMGKGLEPHEISVFVRSTGQVSRATTAIEAAGLHSTVLDDQVQTTDRECLGKHHALGEGVGVPGRGCYGLRRRGHTASGKDRVCH